MARFYRRSRGGYGRRRFSGFRRSFSRFRTRYRTIFKNRYRTRYRYLRGRTRFISRPTNLVGVLKYLAIVALIGFGVYFVWTKYLKGKLIKV